MAGAKHGGETALILAAENNALDAVAALLRPSSKKHGVVMSFSTKGEEQSPRYGCLISSSASNSQFADLCALRLPQCARQKVTKVRAGGLVGHAHATEA